LKLKKLQKEIEPEEKRGGEMQRVTPAMMRDTPIRVSSPFIFSPRTAPAMAVTSKGG
jgi:hypothetical protein